MEVVKSSYGDMRTACLIKRFVRMRVRVCVCVCVCEKVGFTTKKLKF